MKKVIVWLIFLFVVSSVSFGAVSKKVVKKSVVKIKSEFEKPSIIVPVPAPVPETKVEITSFLKKLTMNGSFRVRYTASEVLATADTLSISRARIKLTGEITPDITFLVQPDFSALSTGANVTLTDVYAQFKTPYTTLRVGQFLLPFGYDSSKYKTIFAAGFNPTYYDLMVPARDYGVRAMGEIPMFAGLYYDGAIINGTGGADVNKTKDIVGRINYKNDSLDLGLSGYYGKAGVTEISKKDIGMDVEYKFSPYQVVAEYLTGQNIAAAVKIQDYYLQLSGMFDNHEPLVKYEVYDLDTTTTGNIVNTLTLGYGCYFDKTTKGIINYNMINEETTQINNNTLILEFQTQI